MTRPIKLSFNASCLCTTKALGEFPTSHSRFSLASIKPASLCKVTALKAPATNLKPLLPEFELRLQTLMAGNSRRGTVDTK